MNERIEELFGQALDQAVPETWTMLTPVQLSKLKDRFAELIVLECAAHLHRRGVEGFGILEERSLKEHFGV